MAQRQPEPPLAGRPPFAIDDDAVVYSDPASQPRRQQPKADNPNARTSAYNTYDNYLGENKDTNPRDSHLSGHGAIGGLFGNLSDDDSDDDDERPAPAQPNKSKNQALFEAAVSDPAKNASPTDEKSPIGSSPTNSSPPPAYQVSNDAFADRKTMAANSEPFNEKRPQPTQPLNIAQNQPPAPHFTRNATASPAPPAPLQITIPHAAPQPQRLQPVFMGQGQQPNGRGPGQPQNGQTIQYNGGGSSPLGLSPGTPGFAQTPIQPAFIGPSRTPIQPAFLKWGPDTYPEKSPSSVGHGGPESVGHDSIMPIMRGNTEETLLVKSRAPGVGPRHPMGGRNDGDDFWRRFSMVVKREKAQPQEKKSQWLKTTLSRGSGFTRWVWVIGMFLLLVVVGGSVAIWWFTRSKPDHEIPVAIGGGASQTMTRVLTNPDGSLKTTSVNPILASSTFHPARNVDKRWAVPTAGFDTGKRDGSLNDLDDDAFSPTPTPAPAPPAPTATPASRKRSHNKRMAHGATGLQS